MARRRETDTVLDRPSGIEAPAGFTAPSRQVTGVAPSEPTMEQIAQRAYEIYQSRGGTEGQDIDDWLEAERQLKRGREAATE